MYVACMQERCLWGFVCKCEERNRLARPTHTKEVNFHIIFKWDEKDWIRFNCSGVEHLVCSRSKTQ